MPKRRLAASGGLHNTVASQLERKLQGDVSKHVPFPDAPTLQILDNDILQLWVSLGRLVPFLYSYINSTSNACIYACVSISAVIIGFCSYFAYRAAIL